jgi:hypothetical protein
VVITGSDEENEDEDLRSLTESEEESTFTETTSSKLDEGEWGADLPDDDDDDNDDE